MRQARTGGVCRIDPLGFQTELNDDRARCLASADELVRGCSLPKRKGFDNVARYHPLCDGAEQGLSIVGDIKTQTAQVLRRVDELLELAGTDKSHLLSAQVWIADMRRARLTTLRHLPHCTEVS